MNWYEQKLESIHKQLWHKRLTPFSEYVKLYEALISANCDVFVRHDVDHDLLQAAGFAESEMEYDITTHYYLLHTANYWQDRMAPHVVFIQSCYHDIGLHNDVLTEVILNYSKDTPPDEAVAEVLGNELDYLRQWADVKSTASHGSPHCYTYKYWNYDIFGVKASDTVEIIGMGYDSVPRERPDSYISAPLDMAEFGLEYEAYGIMIDEEYDLYISDSGGKWHYNAMWRGFNQQNIQTIGNVIDMLRFEEKREGWGDKPRKAQLLTHPEYYDVLC
jgi:hypothetical protein